MAGVVADNSSAMNDKFDLPAIGVMILNQNGVKWLSPLYDSLIRQNYPKLRIYLIDNASTDNSISFTQSTYAEVRILRLSRNAGYCMAYNLTMPIAFADGCDCVIWANNDVLLEPGCLIEMGSIARKYRDVGVIGPAFLCWDSAEPNYYMRGKHPEAIAPMIAGSSEPFDVDWVEGSFLMVSRDCVNSVGWLDPFLFFYWEEADFCRRALRSNWRVVLAPKALARHYAGGWSSGNQGNANTANVLKSRNQYIYALADPNRSFVRNLIKCVHLLIVLTKAALGVSVHAALYEIRAFLRLLPELGMIRHKRRRDEIGQSPLPTTAEFADLKVETISSV
jgi:GT2 family glycosyltransferase